MAQFTATALSDSLFSINKMKLYFTTSMNLFISNIVVEEGDESLSDIVVAIGEVYPIAVKIDPASSDYEDFTINGPDHESKPTKVMIQNSSGSFMPVNGDILIDQDNKTVVFGWDTSDYQIDQYVIVLWISITYKNNTYYIRSDSITKSLKQESVLD